MTHADLPPPPDGARLRAAIALLEPHTSHPGTGPLHDPLWEMLQDGDPRHLGALREAMLRYREHPAMEALLEALAPELVLPARSLEEILLRHGPWGGGDPLVEVDRRLQKAARDRVVLEDRLRAADRDLDRMARSNNAFALVAALLAIFALAGWLGALGVWQIEWIEPAAPPPEQGGPLPKSPESAR